MNEPFIVALTYRIKHGVSVDYGKARVVEGLEAKLVVYHVLSRGWGRGCFLRGLQGWTSPCWGRRVISARSVSDNTGQAAPMSRHC